MNLIEKIISADPQAPVVLLFGGSPDRRHQVIKLISEIGELTIYGALNEEEGIRFLKELSKVDLVLIGGAYTDEQRQRIRQYIAHNNPNIKITEPGIQYQYSNVNIQNDIKAKLEII